MRTRSDWNLEVLVFKERGRLQNPEKNLLEQRREQNQEQTQPTYSVWSQHQDANQGHIGGGGRCSHHCATIASTTYKYI